MLLTITTTHVPATDLGYLLHKNPARVQSFPLAYGQAHVAYSEAAAERCTAGLLLDIDPVGLVRGRRGPAGEGESLRQYVNDRPYVASSFMSVALAQVFSTALAGNCKQRPELVDQAIPLEINIAVLPCRGGEVFLRSLFEPLGYEVAAQRLPLDDRFPEWGVSAYFRVHLKIHAPLHLVLSHLYVLMPVLDDDKHYWVTQDETEKLMRHGESWLADHPQREQITRRYLKHQGYLIRPALARLSEDDAADSEEAEESQEKEEARIEKPISLHTQRLDAVLTELKTCSAQRVLDLGCGEGKLLRLLLKEKQFTEIVGLDVSYRSLERAKEKLKFERLPPPQRQRIQLLHGSLVYRDDRLAGFDAAAVVEVIEHLDALRLSAFQRVLFACARPRTVVLTTPNAEYNVKFETLPAGQFRHRDHRFEWTRDEFQSWCDAAAARFGYRVRYAPLGAEDELVGPPSQMGVFTRDA